MVVRTYAPMGKTPILRERLARDHLSAMSGGITLDGKLYTIEQERAFKGEDAGAFPQAPFASTSRQAPGGDLGRLSDYRSKAVKRFLAEGVAQRLRLEQLPGYAPELNPDEGVWKHLKRVELKNLCCQSLSELKVELRKAKERMRHKRDVILGCVRHPGFEV